MGKCPICESEIDYLRVERRPVEYFARLSKRGVLEIEADPQDYDLDVFVGMFFCPKCGRDVADDEYDAEQILKVGWKGETE